MDKLQKEARILLDMMEKVDRLIEKELDKVVDVAIDDTIAAKREKYNFDEEVANAEDTCCDWCQGQATYFARKGK